MRHKRSRTHYASIVLIARRQLLRERAILVESFLKAYSEGAALYRKDKSLAFRVLSKYTKTNDENVLEETYRAYALGAIPSASGGIAERHR